MSRVATILPPEGVPLAFETASLGGRIVALVIDLAIQVIALIALLVLIDRIAGTGPGFILAATFGFFFLRLPYFIYAELFWAGQTLGKRMMGLRVISTGGRALSPYSVTVRNMMREAEVFGPPMALLTIDSADLVTAGLSLAWIVTVITVPLMNPRRQRIGDILAGTWVVRIPSAVLLPDLAARDHAEGGDAFTFEPRHLDHYGRYELQTLEALLRDIRSPVPKRKQELLRNVGETIRTRIDYDSPVVEAQELSFLRGFYMAQRAHLERAKLFGDARENKYHSEDETPPSYPSRPS